MFPSGFSDILCHFGAAEDNTIYTVLLCLYVADPATLLSSNSDLGPNEQSQNTLKDDKYIPIKLNKSGQKTNQNHTKWAKIGK